MDAIGKEQIKIIDFFYENPQRIIDISKVEADDLAYFIFSLLKMNPSNELMSKMVTLLYEICFRDDITLEEVWEIYWNLKSILFNFSEVKIENGSLRRLYTYIFNSICEVIPNKYIYKPMELKNIDTIVIVTSQLLGLGHAPTIRVFDYAYVLQHELKKEVIIINDSAMNFIRNENLDGNIAFNYIDEYESIKYIGYKDEQFRLIQSPHKMPDLPAMIELIDTIYEINPGLVYNIGAESLVADYCSHFTVTACLPCSNDIPISCSKYLMVGRKVGNEDAATIKELSDYQSIIETMVNYEYREQDIEYSRQQFGISEKQFLVAIIGNRLDTEVSDEFIEVLNDILKNVENSSIAFIGTVIDKERMLQKVDQKDRIHTLGSLEQGSKFVKLCDLYLNPKRSGGGRSSFEALHFGVPVVSLEFGDVYYTCGEEFSVKGYEEITKLVYRYCNDGEFRNTKKENAKIKADQLSDIKGTLSKMLEEIAEKENKSVL